MFQFWLYHTEEPISVVKNASPFYLATALMGKKIILKYSYSKNNSESLRSVSKTSHFFVINIIGFF